MVVLVFYKSIINMNQHEFAVFTFNNPETWVLSRFFCIWVNFITTSLFSLTGIMASKGNYPQMAQLFRLVNYYNLPRLWLTIINHILTIINHQKNQVGNHPKMHGKFLSDQFFFRSSTEPWDLRDAHAMAWRWSWLSKLWQVGIKSRSVGSRGYGGSKLL